MEFALDEMMCASSGSEREVVMLFNGYYPRRRFRWYKFGVNMRYEAGMGCRKVRD